ncbi:MAG: hypothetical protein ISN29_10610 [Gammaproteobacteria bacterium AqS3]|nr:hypothetical protein [Gammaproteobacteria bacterium AqS3]
MLETGRITERQGIIAGAVLILIMLCAATAHAQIPASYPWEEKGLKKAQALSTSSGRTITEVDSLVNPEEEGAVRDLAGAKKLLDRMRKSTRTSSYDKAVMWNYYAFIYMEKNEHDNAIRAYQSMLMEPDITEGLALMGMFISAQLYMSQEDFSNGLAMLRRWFKYKEDPDASAYALRAQAYYQLENYDRALKDMLKAISMQEQGEAGRARENWYQIALAIYQKRDDNPGMVGILVKLIQYYPKKIYWKQLSFIYGEQKRIKDRLSAYQMAYRQGMFDEPTEFFTLAQLLMQADRPYRAARVLEDAVKRAQVPIEYKYIRAEADYWRASHEHDKAIKLLEQASELSEKGDDYTLLGNLYYLDEKPKKAEEMLEKGLAKGNVKNEALVYMTLCQVREILGKFTGALSALDKADKVLATERSGLQRELRKDEKDLPAERRKSLEKRLAEVRKRIKDAEALRQYIAGEQKRLASIRQLNQDLSRRISELRTRLAAEAGS